MTESRRHAPKGPRRLTPNQARFVEEYLLDLNASEAAIRAGYSRKNSAQIGWQLLQKPTVAAAVAEAQRARSHRSGISADRVLEEARRVALSDLRSVFDAKGNLVPIHKLSDDAAAAIAGVEVIVKNAQAGDGHTDTIHKIKTWDKPKALDMLMKHLRLYEEQAHVSGTIELVWGGNGS